MALFAPSAKVCRFASRPYYLSLIDPTDPSCPIRRQCVPDGRENDVVPGDLVDPLGEGFMRSPRIWCSATPIAFCSWQRIAAPSTADSVRAREWSAAGTARCARRAGARVRVATRTSGGAGCHRQRWRPARHGHRSHRAPPRRAPQNRERRDHSPCHARPRHAADARDEGARERAAPRTIRFG